MDNFLYFFIRLRNGRCRRELGEKLQELRREQRKTIGVISYKTGIAPCVIDCIELGLNAHIKGLEKLCAYYGKRIELCLRDITPEEAAQILDKPAPAIGVKPRAGRPEIPPQPEMSADVQPVSHPLAKFQSEKTDNENPAQ